MAADPYKVLGLARNASDADIRTAYRTLAKKYHPDRNPDDAKSEARFKEINAAFDILGDAAKRARFDRGEIDGDGNEQGYYSHRRPGGGDQTDPFASNGGFDDLGDIFSDIFSGRRQTTARKGRDVRYELEVDFKEAVLGVKKRVTMQDGRSLDLTIPKGAREGQSLRLRGQGEPGAGGGPNGDVYVQLKVREHPVFKRVDHDIRIDAPISLTEAVLGAKINVPTVDGTVAVTVPKGSNTGTLLRLRGKGVPNARTSERGDQYIRLVVMLPDRPDAELEKFVKNWKGRDYAPRKTLNTEKS